MSSTPAPDDVDGFPVMVAEDGNLPASELARVDLRPAARTRMAGALATSVPAGDVDALIRGLDEAKDERISCYRAATDQT